MKKITLNSALLCILPIFVFIPIVFQLRQNIHFGGKDLFLDFIFSSIKPKIDYEILRVTIIRLKETFFIALLSWIISLSLGTIMGLLSSNIFYKFFNIPIILKKILKFFLTIIRSIHELIWGLILIQINGISISAGIIAICIPYTAINAKVISEQLNNIDQKKISAIEEINGNKLSSLITMVWNPIFYIFENFGKYRLECALRSTVILGLFGIGGIGTSIFLSFQSLNFRELWTYLWSLALLIILTIDCIERIKFKKILSKSYSFLFFVSPFILIITIILLSIYIFNSNKVFRYLLDNISFLQNNFISIKLLQSSLETILIGLLSSGIAICLPPFLLFIFNNNFLLFILRSLAFLLRLIPTPITLLILLMFNDPSISLAAFTLGFHNAGITYKLLESNLIKTDKKEYFALNSLGVSKRMSWFLGLFNKQAKSYLAYCAYRSDIIMRETAIVGVIGSFGLGWQLRESLSSFAWGEVSIIIFAYSLIATLGEIINAKVRSRLN